MLQNTIEDIIAYLGFVRSVGYSLSVCVSDKTLKPCLSLLAPYAPSHGNGNEAVIPISHGERLIARVHVSTIEGKQKLPGKERVRALTAPLCYMFERLYEQCCEYSEQNTVVDAYHKALVFIRNHYTEGISVADVAGGIGYSASYFGYVFKKTSGISVNKYICEMQLSKAAELLRDTSSSVSEISGRVGFVDANYFSTVFKARYGISPRQYRKENKK